MNCSCKTEHGVLLACAEHEANGPYDHAAALGAIVVLAQVDSVEPLAKMVALLDLEDLR